MEFSGQSPNRLSRLKPFPPAVDLDQRVRRDQEEPPRPVLGPEPEFGRDGRVPGNDPELGNLFFEIIGKLPGGREDLRREHDPGERDRDLRYDHDVEDPLRPAQCQLDDTTRLCDGDRFRQRPVGAGAGIKRPTTRYVYRMTEPTNAMGEDRQT